MLLLIISLPTNKQEEEKSSGTVLDEENVLTGEKATGTAEINANTEESAQNKAVEVGNFNNNSSYEIDDYVEKLEKRLEEVISGMEGVGKVQVMITVSDTGTEILERDREISTSDLEETDDTGGTRKSTENGQREEVIYSRDKDGNEIPYVVQRKLPEVTGVVVIAEGAGNARVKENIIGAVEVLFNLNEHRIRVIRMKS